MLGPLLIVYTLFLGDLNLDRWQLFDLLQDLKPHLYSNDSHISISALTFLLTSEHVYQIAYIRLPPLLDVISNLPLRKRNSYPPPPNTYIHPCLLISENGQISGSTFDSPLCLTSHIQSVRKSCRLLLNPESDQIQSMIISRPKYSRNLPTVPQPPQLLPLTFTSSHNSPSALFKTYIKYITSCSKLAHQCA